jgi:hypothetical protein
LSTRAPEEDGICASDMAQVLDFLLAEQFEDVEQLRHADRMWLTACKAARHLAIQPPARTLPALEEFLRRHEEAFLRARAAAKQRRPGSA